MSKKKSAGVALNHIVTSVLVRAEARKTLRTNPDLIIDLIVATIPLTNSIDQIAPHLTETSEFQKFVTLLAKILNCKNSFAKRRTR